MGDRVTQNDVEGVLSYIYQLENLPAFEDVEGLRWRVLIDCDGERIGTIEDIERHEDSDRVEFLQIGRGGFLGFGAERFLVPVTAIVRVDDKNVCIDRSIEHLDGVPAYDHERAHEPEYCAGVRAWWCSPDASPEPS